MPFNACWVSTYCSKNLADFLDLVSFETFFAALKLRISVKLLGKFMLFVKTRKTLASFEFLRTRISGGFCVLF